MKNILLWFFGILRLAHLISGSVVKEKQCFVPGECTQGLHVDFQWAKDQNECLSLCNDNFMCRWFTFYPTTSTCQLFVTCGTIETSQCHKCVTGQRDCIPVEPLCFISGKCIGNVVKTEQGVSRKDDCLSACKTTKTCSWFTFYSKLSTCVLMRNCIIQDATEGEVCLYGQAACQPKRKNLFVILTFKFSSPCKIV